MNERMQELHDGFEAMAEDLIFQGVIGDDEAQFQERFTSDPEWTEKKWTHVSTIFHAFVHGVISADIWHKGYALPPNFESVINWIAWCVQKEWPDIEVVEVSLIDIETLFRRWAPQHPEFRKWNEPNDPDQIVAVVSRYSDTPDERDFIDLDALFRNGVIWLRNTRRDDDRFEVEFEKNHGHLTE